MLSKDLQEKTNEIEKLKILVPDHNSDSLQTLKVAFEEQTDLLMKTRTNHMQEISDLKRKVGFSILAQFRKKIQISHLFAFVSMNKI